MLIDAHKNVRPLEELKQEAFDELAQVEEESTKVKTQQDLEAHEQKILSISRRIADITTAISVQRLLDNSEFRKEGKAFLRSCCNTTVCKGLRTVRVRFAGGTEIPLTASYWGRKKFKGKGEKGIFPELILLGIYHKCTPSLSIQIALTSTALGSFEEAQNMLAAQGCKLDIKTIIRLTKLLAGYARVAQEKQIVSKEDPVAEKDNLAGRKVVIAVDGGRMRIRQKKRGPKSAKNHNRYRADWREPKLLIIYVSQGDGRLDRSFIPMIDGTLDGPDAMFALLYRHLILLNVGEADQVLFIADGARWIWDRIPTLKQLLSLSGVRFDPLELIDFYHAAQHLHEFSIVPRK